jgi:transposase
MNFLACDREQPFLMPPDPRDWLPEDRLAWFLLASVEQMDLSAFYGSYRVDGWGRAAFEPSMMVSLLLYAYARGERSSRGIERKCVLSAKCHVRLILDRHIVDVRHTHIKPLRETQAAFRVTCENNA